MFPLFSVDDHVIEHGTVRTDRVPARHREKAPHVVEGADGTKTWTMEGRPGKTSSLGLDAGAGSILASVGFPSLPRFGGMLFSALGDKSLADAGVRATGRSPSPRSLRSRNVP